MCKAVVGVAVVLLLRRVPRGVVVEGERKKAVVVGVVVLGATVVLVCCWGGTTVPYKTRDHSFRTAGCTVIREEQTRPKDTQWLIDGTVSNRVNAT